MTLSVQASGVFCLDLLALALCFRVIAFHVARLATQVTLARKPLTINSSSSTQLHGHIPTISTCTTMIIMAVLWASRRVLQRLLPGTGKPHGTVSAVSKRHGMPHIAWVPQHRMSLHVLLQPMQICQKQVMGAHEVPNLQYNDLELLVVPSYRGPLP